MNVKRCNDCGVDVWEIGDWYMAPSKIWGDKLGLGWDDNLCLTCLERRLGRPVKLGDIVPVITAVGGGRTLSTVPKLSPRLKEIFAPKKPYTADRAPSATPRRPSPKRKRRRST